MALMPPRLRKLALTAHVTTSVGWLGAVAAFLAVAVAGLTGDVDATARGAYVACELLAWTVVVPLALASLVTGVVQSLGTPWGLFRHWWVVVKLALTVLATGFLLLHTRPIGHLGGVARAGAPLGDDLDGMRLQLVVDAAAAVVVLLVVTALAVCKPRGVTRLGRRRGQAPPQVPLSVSDPDVRDVEDHGPRTAVTR